MVQLIQSNRNYIDSIPSYCWIVDICIAYISLAWSNLEFDSQHMNIWEALLEATKWAWIIMYRVVHVYRTVQSSPCEKQVDSRLKDTKSGDNWINTYGRIFMSLSHHAKTNGKIGNNIICRKILLRNQYCHQSAIGWWTGRCVCWGLRERDRERDSVQICTENRKQNGSVEDLGTNILFMYWGFGSTHFLASVPHCEPTIKCGTTCSGGAVSATLQHLIVSLQSGQEVHWILSP